MLYDPALSTRGALLSVRRAPRAANPFDFQVCGVAQGVPGGLTSISACLACAGVLFWPVVGGVCGAVCAWVPCPRRGAVFLQWLRGAALVFS